MLFNSVSGAEPNPPGFREEGDGGPGPSSLVSCGRTQLLFPKDVLQKPAFPAGNSVPKNGLQRTLEPGRALLHPVTPLPGSQAPGKTNLRGSPQQSRRSAKEPQQGISAGEHSEVASLAQSSFTKTKAEACWYSMYLEGLMSHLPVFNYLTIQCFP